jgi:hypothetical protein
MGICCHAPDCKVAVEMGSVVVLSSSAGTGVVDGVMDACSVIFFKVEVAVEINCLAGGDICISALQLEIIERHNTKHMIAISQYLLVDSNLL